MFEKHLKPISSRTILLANLYQNPTLNDDDYGHANGIGSETSQIIDNESVIKNSDTVGTVSQIDDSPHSNSGEVTKDETVKTQEVETENSENIAETGDVKIDHNEDQKQIEDVKESDKVESSEEVQQDDKLHKEDTLEKESEDNIKQDENIEDAKLEDTEKDKLPEFTILQSQKILINFSKISLSIFPNLDKLEILLCVKMKTITLQEMSMSCLKVRRMHIMPTYN